MVSEIAALLSFVVPFSYYTAKFSYLLLQIKNALGIFCCDLRYYLLCKSNLSV